MNTISFSAGTCGTDPCSSNSCGSSELQSPLCSPQLSLLPMVPHMRLIGVIGNCLVSMKCDTEGFLVNGPNGAEITKSPCVDIPWLRTILLEDGEILLNSQNLPIEGDPPSPDALLATTEEGCMRRWRGPGSGRFSLISLDGVMSWVSAPALEEEQSFCTNTTNPLVIVPGATTYTVQVLASGIFVVGQGINISGRLFRVVSKPNSTTLVIELLTELDETVTIASGSLACYSAMAFNCDNTPVYNPDEEANDEYIRSIKICTDKGDKLLRPIADRIIVGVEDEGGLRWELQAKAVAQTGLMFFPVTPRQYKQVSTVKTRDTMHSSSVTFDGVPIGQIPAIGSGRTIYMAVNIYTKIGMSALRHWNIKVYDKAGGSNDDLVLLQASTNTAGNSKVSQESNYVIVKCPDQNNPRKLDLWHLLTGAHDNPLNFELSAQIVGFYV